MKLIYKYLGEGIWLLDILCPNQIPHSSPVSVWPAVDKKYHSCSSVAHVSVFITLFIAFSNKSSTRLSQRHSKICGRPAKYRRDFW